MIDRNAMALYVKVVENHSFSKTARREKVPVSTISRKISELEKSLGVRLMERSTRQLRITDIGQEYYEHCRRGLEAFDEANLLINDRHSEVSGVLRLSVPPNLSDVIVAPLVSGFQALYPDVVFRVLVTDRHVHLIEDNVDLALRIGELEDSTLIARRLLRYRHLIVASPGYLNSVAPPKHPRELNEHPLIVFGPWYEDRLWHLTDGRHREKILVKSKFSINDFSGIQKAILDGAGIGEIPSIICGTLLQTGALVEIMPAWRFEPVTISLVYSGQQNFPRAARLFKDYCIDNIENMCSSNRANL